jgi:hypothetical protein
MKQVCACKQLKTTRLARQPRQQIEVRLRGGLVVAGPGAHADQPRHGFAGREPLCPAVWLLRQARKEHRGRNTVLHKLIGKDGMRLEPFLEWIEGNCFGVQRINLSHATDGKALVMKREHTAQCVSRHAFTVVIQQKRIIRKIFPAGGRQLRGQS